jgi:hypothetical protein
MAFYLLIANCGDGLILGDEECDSVGNMSVGCQSCKVVDGMWNFLLLHLLFAPFLFTFFAKFSNLVS